MNIKQVGRVSPVVPLARAKEHLRVDHSDDDLLIAELVEAATEHVSLLYDRTIGIRTWLWTVDREYCRNLAWLDVPLPPLRSIAAVRYKDSLGAVTDYATSAYEVVKYDTHRRSLIRMISPAVAGDVVNVQFEAGDDEVPAGILHAIKLHVGALYENRGEMIDGKLVEDRARMHLLSPFRPMVA